MSTIATLQAHRPKRPRFATATARTPKSLRPAYAEKVCPAILLVAETGLQLTDISRVVVHQPPNLNQSYYLLGPPASSKYPLYTKSSTLRILGLQDGGTGHLPRFIGNYKEETDKFEAPGLENAFIILFDNDSGGDPVCHAVRNARPDKKMDRTAPFTHVTKNLYAVPTPLIASQKSSKIEDFFDTATLGTILGGKTFIPENKFDEKKYYGKHIFADGVVAKHAKTINFSGFKPLLTNICTVIKEHSQKLPLAATTAPE
jgi:hypothetical protein